MISFRWQGSLDRTELAEVEELLTAAVPYDAEAGFSTAEPRAEGDDQTRHLLVRMAPRGERGSSDLDRLPDVSVVAYLRLDMDDGQGALQFVVHPEFRSLGVGTLLFERLRDESGWAEVSGLTSVHTWAHGAHPAADRMAKRLGASVTDAWFKTLRFLGGAEPFIAAE
ncbi:MAG TPA: GNAT family N-acetyltransferase, partial [Marmoricola sp.]|nr:GNAT family N-acetyltransferase [Marmoricola sp.]